MHGAAGVPAGPRAEAYVLRAASPFALAAGTAMTCAEAVKKLSDTSWAWLRHAVTAYLDLVGATLKPRSLASTEVVYGVPDPDVTVLPSSGVLP